MMVLAGFHQLTVFEEGEAESHDSWIVGNDSKNWRGTGFEPRPEPVANEDTTCPSVPVTNPGKIARRADTAKDGDKVLHMVWQMPINGNYEICYTNNRGDGREGNMGIGNGWNTALRLSFTPTHSVLPDIEIDTENNIILVTWTEKRVPEMEYYTMSFDGGRTWMTGKPNPGILLLKAEEFDPLVEYPDFPEDLMTNKHTGYYLLQFRVPPMVEWIQKMRDMGISFLGYIPDNGYLVAMDKTTRVQADKLVYVRWTDTFQPVYKVSPDLQGASGPVELTVQMLADNWPDVLMDIESMGSVLSFMSLSGALANVVLSVDASKIAGIANIDDVFWLEHYAAPSPSTEVIDQIIAGNYNLVAGANVPTGPGYNAWLNNLGLDGSGVNVSVVDSGIDTGVLATMHRDIRGRVQNLADYTETDNSDGVCEDEWWHGTHLAGIVAGDATIGTTDNRNYLYGLGGAPAADLLCQRIFNRTAAYSNTADNVLTAWAVNNSADISSNSWGTSGAANLWGNYLAASRDYDILVRDANPWAGGNQSLIIVFSAGNDGFDANINAVRPNSIHAQGSAKNVITVGASESYRTAWAVSDDMDDIAFFSSRGPTDDNRLKPDIVTPGTQIGSLNSSVGWSNGWGPIGGTNDYIWGGGTSMATPLASAAAALFVQYYDDLTGNRPSPALTKAALINGCRRRYPQQRRGLGQGTPRQYVRPRSAVHAIRGRDGFLEDEPGRGLQILR
jgi:subtilisin family serine protease